MCVYYVNAHLYLRSAGPWHQPPGGVAKRLGALQRLPARLQGLESPEIAMGNSSVTKKGGPDLDHENIIIDNVGIAIIYG